MSGVKRDSVLFQTVQDRSAEGYRPITYLAPDFQMMNTNYSKLLREGYFRGVAIENVGDSQMGDSEGSRSVVTSLNVPSDLQAIRGGSYEPINLGLNEIKSSISNGQGN